MPRKKRSAISQSSERKRRNLDKTRKVDIRAMETDAASEVRREQNRTSMEGARATETEMESEVRREQNRTRMEAARATETEMESEVRREQNRTSMEAARATETEMESEEHREQNRTRMVAMRAAETPEEHEQRILGQRNRQEGYRNRAQNRPHEKKACFASNVFSGEQIVECNYVGPLIQLDGTPSSQPCQHCCAVKWKNETPGMCCGKGKVKLNSFGEQPTTFRRLWEGQDHESKIFRKYSRQLNNALSLAVLQVKYPQLPGRRWQPSVVIQGKVFIGMGPLLPNQGEHPVFAQLYVVDPDHADSENEIRFANMNLPSSVSAAEKNTLHQLLVRLQQELHRCNPYVHDFKHACEIVQSDGFQGNVQLVIDEKKRPEGEHARRFNSGFKEISVVMDDQNPGKRAFVVSLRQPPLHGQRPVKEIPDTHRSVDPLHFVLLFPEGTDGWHLGLHDENKITALQFYAFHLQLRFQHGAQYPDFLFHGSKLFQEYCCVSFAKVENQNLKFIHNNQKNLRAELYDRLCEDVHNHARSGQKVILPPSFVGSPRYMHAHYQDAIAIVREYHKPDFFITFTCNPNWPEITQSLLPGQKPEDRPDIVARVFNQKLKEFLKELNDGSIFGKRAAIMHIIEFQKRGLPHAHILLIVAEEDRLHRADDVDEVICAELPADPQNFQPGSQKRYQAEKLQEVVLKNMIHSCSPLCLDENKLCKKGFPKQYVEVTEWDDMAFYPKYKRRSPSQGGRVIQVSDKWIDNSSVVPYNPYLTLRYEAHINVEACVSPTAAKYLFKYVTKGPDRAMVGTDVDLDEVKHYQNMRSIGSSEACWRLFQFLITTRYPAVMALRVHLPGKEYVLFNEGEEAAAAEAGPPRTELGAFFDYNHVHPETKLKYVDFPKSFTWNAQRKQWKPRQRGFGGMVGRVHTIHPLAGDEFYLRILLHHDHCKGATSYEHLRTVNGRICETFKDACQELGLLRDDNEWNQVLLEAELTQFSSQIRDLFITILFFCQPSQPKVLFSNHVGQWWDDFKRRFPQASNNVLTWLVLQDLGEKLQQRGKCLADYNLPVLTDEQQNEVQQMVNQNHANDIPVMMQDELRFGLEETIQLKEQHIMTLTPSQRVVFREVIQAIEQNKSLALFVDARGGTGKTFLLNTILAEVRTMNNQKNIALAVASSGIAATLLALGRTYHSRFKAPLKANEHSTLAIKPSDVLATMIKESKLIVWDEAPMTNKNQLEALDRTLRDITSIQRPFGGKLLILAGDFRQVLPVVQHGSRVQITDASLKKSQLWNYFQVFQLTENMRIGQNPELRCYDDWLLQVGNGTLPVNESPDFVEIDEQYAFEIDDQSVETVKQSREKFIDLIFPNLNARYLQDPEQWIQWIAERAILAPKNSAADRINELICDRFPGDPIILSSADSTVNPDDATRFPVEYLNGLTPAGLPPHRLYLKKKMILMLLRNINPRQGLCNGTRLILEDATNILLTCKIASGENASKDVFIPRIELTTKDGDFPFEWKRRQFPVRPAFALTINKSQGQTLKKVGVWLDEPVFTHGQLYVSASRVGDPRNLHLAIRKSANRLTRNVVYKEVL